MWTGQGTGIDEDRQYKTLCRVPVCLTVSVTGQGTMCVKEVVLTRHSSHSHSILTTQRSMDILRHISKSLLLLGKYAEICFSKVL